MILIFSFSSSTVYALHLPALQLHTAKPAMQFGQEDFEKAKAQLQFLKNDPGNEIKLQLYSLFKQVGLAVFIAKLQQSFEKTIVKIVLLGGVQFCSLTRKILKRQLFAHCGVV